MGQGPSSSHRQHPNHHSNQHHNGSGGTMNGCTGGAAKGLMRRASSLTNTPTSRLRNLRSPFNRRKNKRAPLSATFTAPNTVTEMDTININVATEEQLMTLPGVDRKLAQTIVEYRTKIGGRFQKVDDLALVSGMGAERLDRIRGEICVRRPRLSQQQHQQQVPSQGSMNGSSSISSRTPSIDSIGNTSALNDATNINIMALPLTSQHRPKVNVNLATVFELQQVPGLNQELAAKIVDHRSRKGHFKTVDHLLKVKGISSSRLSNIRPLLCSTTTISTNGLDSMSLANFTPTSVNAPAHAANERMVVDSAPPTPCHINPRKSISVPMRMNYKLANGFHNVPIDDIFELLGAYSHRPVVVDTFRHERNGHGALRVASWNLDRITLAKANNPGVLEVICRTILENKLSIICVQEVMEAHALTKICDELNRPTLRRVTEWRDNMRNWKYVVVGGGEAVVNGQDGAGCGGLLGFIYDNQHCRFVPKLAQEIPLITNDQCQIKPSAYLGVFVLEDWKLSILNLYLRHFNMARISDAVTQIRAVLDDGPIPFDDIYMVCGDFTGMSTGPAAGTMNGERRSSKWHVDEDEDHTSPHVDAVNLDELNFNQIFDANITSFVDTLHGGTGIDDGLNLSPSVTRANVKTSSCNILCRDKLPQRTDPFREAIYRTKTPSELTKEMIANHQDGVRWCPENDHRLTGYSNVIREGLCHMAIPRDWSWGGPASDHCPIWIECYQRLIKYSIKSSNGNHNTSNGGDLISTMSNGLTKLNINHIGNGTAAIGDSNIRNGKDMMPIACNSANTNNDHINSTRHVQ